MMETFSERSVFLLVQLRIQVLETNRVRIVFGAIISYLVLNIAAFALNGRISDFWQFWLAPALLIWYLLTQRWSIHAAEKMKPVSS